MFLRILWMHDLSGRSEAAGDLLLWLALRSDAEVLLVHALGAPTGAASAADDPVLQARREEAESHLQPVVARLTAEGVRATLRVIVGQPMEVAERLVDLEQIGLVFAGATGMSGVDRVLLGSNTARLVRGLRCSVLVARPPFARIRRILCAVDLRHVHDAVILQAAALARRSGAHLEFITVVEPALDLAETAPAEERLPVALREVLGEDLDAGWTTAVITAESATFGILHRAPLADIVVMGTEGRRGLRRLLLGSTAEAVVRQCPVSVLVAR